MLSSSAAGGIQKQRFEQIIDLVQDLYEPEFQNRQKRLRIMDYWESERLEASARTDMDTEGLLVVITVTGGLARHDMITEGAFALVICHEIGHFLAGLPSIGRFSWGQNTHVAFLRNSTAPRSIHSHGKISFGRGFYSRRLHQLFIYNSTS